MVEALTSWYSVRKKKTNNNSINKATVFVQWNIQLAVNWVKFSSRRFCTLKADVLNSSTNMGEISMFSFTTKKLSHIYVQ